MRTKLSQSGFSLVETLVAITILLIVIVGPMTISTKASQSTSFASEQVTAYLLAQEGAELAQKARDDLMLEFYNSTMPNPWDEFTDSSNGATYRWCHEPDRGCGMHTLSSGELSTPVRCGDDNNSACVLRYDAVGTVRSRYNYASGDATDYRRRILFENVAGGDQVKVISKVDWRSGDSSVVKSVQVETYLFNIYDN